MEEHTLPHGSYSGNGGGSGGGGGGQQRQQPGENFGMFGKLGMPASAAMLISQMSGVYTHIRISRHNAGDLILLLSPSAQRLV